MELNKKFFSQNSAQKERGTQTDMITTLGKPSQSNLFEQYIAYASSLGYTVKENGAYFAIEYNDLYIVRVYKKNDLYGFFDIRYKDFISRSNPLIQKASKSGGKLRNSIQNNTDLKYAQEMLANYLEV